MSKKAIRLITLLLAVAMVAALAAGCGGSETKKPGGSDLGGVTLTEEEIANLKGTKVTYVTWKDPDENEDGVAVEKFEEKYGIDLHPQLINEYNYVSIIAADIAAGTQGDVFFENGEFPGSLKVMQPLEAARLDLSDPIWNQSLIKASTLDGHPYLVDAISNVWTEVDICIYNKKIFDDNGIKNPEEYYNEGKWTFENFRFAANEVAKADKTYVGAEIIGEAALGAAGSSIFTYKDNKMQVTIDEHLMEVMNFLAQMKADGIAKLGRLGFQNGRTGMGLTNCFALKKTGYLTKVNPDHLRATYLPVWKEGDEQVVTGIYRGWGLIDGAKNPLGAGLFLREYLDVNNYDLINTFHNQEVMNFFFQVTGEYSENMLYYHGPDMVKTSGMGKLYHEAWDSHSPTQLPVYIESEKNVMNQMCEKANEIIEQERKWIKEAEEKGTIHKYSEE